MSSSCFNCINASCSGGALRTAARTNTAFSSSIDGSNGRRSGSSAFDDPSLLARQHSSLIMNMLIAGTSDGDAKVRNLITERAAVAAAAEGEEVVGKDLKNGSIHATSAIAALRAVCGEEMLCADLSSLQHGTAIAPDFDPDIPALPPPTPASTTWVSSCNVPLPHATPCGVGLLVPAFSNGAVEFESNQSNYVVLKKKKSSPAQGGPFEMWQTVSQCVLGRPLEDCNDGDSPQLTPPPSSKDDTYDEVDDDDTAVSIFSGMRWECLEYARRFYICHFNATFDSLSGADKLWDLSSLVCVRRGIPLELEKYPNGSTSHPPQVGDMLVYPRLFPEADCPYGHVSIVVSVHLIDVDEKDEENEMKRHAAGDDNEGEGEADDTCAVVASTRPPTAAASADEQLIGWVCIAEQNWDNCRWTHVRYARRLALTCSIDRGYYRVWDCKPYRAVGWIRLKAQPTSR